MIGVLAAPSQRYEERFEQGPKMALHLLKAGDRFLCAPTVTPAYTLPACGQMRSWVVNEQQFGGDRTDVTDEDNGEIWRLRSDSQVVILVEEQS